MGDPGPATVISLAALSVPQGMLDSILPMGIGGSGVCSNAWGRVGHGGEAHRCVLLGTAGCADHEQAVGL